MKLDIAVQAPLPAYPALVLASLGNQLTAESPFDFSITDAKDLEKQPITIDGKPVTTEEAVKQVLSTAGKALEVDEKWTKVAFGPLSLKNFKEVMPALEEIEQFLNFRSFFSQGTSAGGNDALIWGALRANGVVGSACKSGVYVNLARWYRQCEALPSLGGAVEYVQNQLKEIRHAAKLQSTKKKESKANFDIDLIDAKDGEVVTRFPPEPSGFMHIGHAKAAILNEYFAKQYHGKLIVRFDDTNPSKEKEEFTESILEDIALLGIKPDIITYSSDYFQYMYDLAVQMIKDGLAYCDDTELELMREQRGEGIASARRDRSVEENLRVFCTEMKGATEEGLKNCLRAKISVDDNNKTMRDPVVYRCNLTPHVRTGETWKIYPTYDFCSPVIDAKEGVTHALRSNEYRDRNAQYAWMLQALKLRTVHIWDFSRINFMRTLLSKRKLQWFVDTGRVAGWDDPRFPTVKGVRRRGMTVEGLRQFIISQGPSRNILNLDWSLIWNFNKKVVDPTAPRYTAIEKPCKFVLSDNVEEHLEERALHKKNPDVGTKKVWLSNKLLIEQDDASTLKVGEELTLMDWGNAIVDEITGTGAETVVKAHLHLEGDFKKTEHKITWLADVKDNVKVKLFDFDHLITKEKLEEEDKFEDFLTPETVFESEAVADHNIASVPKWLVLQFERKGYYIVDVAAKDGESPVLFSVPDGKVVHRYGAKK